MILSKNGITSINLSELVEGYRLRNELPKLVFLVPTNRNKRELHMTFLKDSDTKSVHRLHIETLQSMAVTLLSHADISFRLIDEAAAFVLLRQAVNEIHSEYFKPYKGEMPEGVQKKLLSVFTNWKREQITPSSLLQEADNFQSDYEKQKLREVIDIYSGYQEKLQATSYADIGEYMLQVLARKEQLRALFDAAYPGAEYIIVRGFSEFAALEVEFITQLADLGNPELFIDFPYYLGNREIFGCLDDVYRKFQTLGFTPVEDKEASRETAFIKTVKARLFKLRKQEADAQFSDRLFAFTGRTLEEEVQIIAREIKKLCVEENVLPSDICVLVNLIEQYGPIFRDVFKAYGLPINLTDRPYLRSLLPVIDILSFFEILNDDFYFKTLFRTFSAGFIPLESCSLYDMQWVAEKFNVIGGRKTWQNTVLRAEEMFRRGELEIYELDRVKRVKAGIDSVAKALQPFRGELSPAEFLQHTRELISGFNFISVMKTFSVAEGGKVLGAISGFMETVTEVVSLLELEYGYDIRRRLPFYLKNLQQALSFTRFTEREPERFGITVTTPNEARGLSFSYAFIAGLFDGNFPARYTADLFTPENFARTELKHLYEQQFAFFQSLERWNKRLYLSYPLKDDRQELMPSRFLTAFKKAFITAELPIQSESNRLYSRQEILQVIGKGNMSPVDKKAVSAGIQHLTETVKEQTLIDEGRRNADEEFAAYNGALAPQFLGEEALSKLAREKDKYYSISQFESYAGCPYRYYAERVLRLEEIVEPEEEADVRIIGSIIHDILYRFLSWCRQENICLSNCEDPVFHRATEEIFSIAKAIIEDENQHVVLSFWDKERILGVDGKREQSILYNFLEYERQPSILMPELFETAFGMKDSSGEYPPLEIDGIKLRGKIDRIDRTGDKSYFTVVDYKTGNAPKRPLVEDGISLQLPLYLEAAQQVLKEMDNVESKPLKPEIFQVKTKTKALGRIYLGEMKPHVAPAPDSVGPDELAGMNKDAEQLMQNAKDKIRSYNLSMQQGDFPIKPYKKAGYDPCRYCTFQAVCRVGELSVS